MGLSGTTWDTNTLLTWANMNHMGHYAPIWDTKPADVTSPVEAMADDTSRGRLEGVCTAQCSEGGFRGHAFGCHRL